MISFLMRSKRTRLLQQALSCRRHHPPKLPPAPAFARGAVLPPGKMFVMLTPLADGIS